MTKRVPTSTSDAEIRAAGGVLWRPAEDSIEVAVVHRPRYDDWSLPKGKLHHGEHPLLGAAREVVEETGITPRIGPRLPTVSYLVRSAGGEPTPKSVDYWAMRALDPHRTVPPNDEVDALAWLAPDAAARRLSYSHDREVMEAFLALPHITSTVLLVRHARAGERKSWNGNDLDRPLDDQGRRQAELLASALPWFGPQRIITADPLRCVQTVRPLATALGLDIEVDPVFSERHHTDHPDAAAKALQALTDGAVTVVCSQGAVIPDLVASIRGRSIDESVPNTVDIRNRKGSVRVMSFHHDDLVATDYISRWD